jgi:hypothetical protein
MVPKSLLDEAIREKTMKESDAESQAKVAATFEGKCKALRSKVDSLRDEVCC